ncbi:hypothetical protein RFH42_02470 [Acinetobacter rudis]|uniref:hypothetical protein n=1 Tax=Acinetobacter rudis TaxID=632955 RepID=UPI00280E230D|nr:hypothetical protein [Acinetobacter rudis]MDQ8951820.1 hypothetical protein [Acinetobacter rudis]
MKKSIIILSLAFTLSACVTPYKDPRSPDVQKNQLIKSLNELVGNYKVVDSRNDDYKNFSSFKISNENNQMNIEILSSKNELLQLNGKECIGRYKEQEKDAFVICTKPSANISMFTFERILTGEKITDGAIVGGFKTLEVKKGDYLLSFWTRNGRPHHYVLNRQ